MSDTAANMSVETIMDILRAFKDAGRQPSDRVLQEIAKAAGQSIQQINVYYGSINNPGDPAL